MMDLSILAVQHDKLTGFNGYADTMYSDLFEFVGSGVSRRAYRCTEDGNVYKVGLAGVNVDEHLAFKWFARNFASLAPAHLQERMLWPTVHSFRFSNGYSANVMPFFEHEIIRVKGTRNELLEMGYPNYMTNCWIHYNDYAACDCIMEVIPLWTQEVTSIFSKMGCMDFDLGRNAFVVREQIVPIDLGYWGLSEAWGGERSVEPWRV
jgi:hypothetical protein